MNYMHNNDVCTISRTHRKHTHFCYNEYAGKRSALLFYRLAAKRLFVYKIIQCIDLNKFLKIKKQSYQMNSSRLIRSLELAIIRSMRVECFLNCFKIAVLVCDVFSIVIIASQGKPCVSPYSRVVSAINNLLL